ncbi:hypothetical protein KJA16_00690 [Patescibacteria group bacterium]|nr:hypothetical protein [Patescibacteria group bacterium]MBZ9578226.1 hypothetical protein [Patescibacteria group bacterium]
MKLILPNVNKIISPILKIESTFGSEEIHPSLGYIKRRQTIEDCRKSYLKQLSQNRKGKPIQIFNTFTMNLLMRAMPGERGAYIYRQMNAEFKTFNDIIEDKAKVVLKKAKYRWGVKSGTKVFLGAKKVLFKKYKKGWERYFKEAEKKYKENFPDDPFLNILNIGFKVRDLALSCFSKLYAANDLHVVRVLSRTGLLVYGYGDIDLGTNPGNEKNYIFLRNLIIRLSEKSGYSPGELDRIFWHFGRDVCSAKPKCNKCLINKVCLTNRGIG